MIGFVLVVAGDLRRRSGWPQSPTLAPSFTLSGMTLAVCVIIYGFLASALPVWLLLAPRDYLSTFVKLGVVLHAGRRHPVRPAATRSCPRFTRFIDGTGPIFAGKIFPFCFITIACGAISGFHALISSGTTPKMIAQGVARLAGRLRLDAAGELRRHHGDDRGLRARSPASTSR